jgi:hypothetical protein
MRNKPHRKGDRLIEFVRDVMDRDFIVLEVCSGFTDVLRDLGVEVLKNPPELILIEIILSCASEPFARELPCEKRVRWVWGDA